MPDPNISSTRGAWRDFPLKVKAHFELDLMITLFPEVLVHLDDGQKHRFDLGSKTGDVLIECKSYAFTATGNEPAAKLNNAKSDALLLRASNARRKLIVFDNDMHAQKGSLAGLFARRNRAWLGDVEVWRHWQGLFGIVDRGAG